MPRNRLPEEERSIIYHRREKRPYGVRLRVHVKTDGSLGELDNVCVPLESGAFITLSPTHKAPWEGGKRFQFTLEGFPTAVAAEASGRRLVQALLWLAISRGFGLGFEYSSYEPAAVYERNRTEGPSVIGYGDAIWSPTSVIKRLQEDFSTLPDPDSKVLLSMEIFAGARLEVSQRALYLALVSALEPLAQVKPFGPEVDAFVQQSITVLRSLTALSVETRNSLEGRLNQLRQESVRQALMRFVRETIPDNVDAPRAIDEAYALRSQLIHTGQPEDLDIDLDFEITAVSSLVQSIYVSLLRRPCNP